MADALPVRVGPNLPPISDDKRGKKNESLKPEDKGIAPNGPVTDGPIIEIVDGEGAGAVSVYKPAQYRTNRGLTRQDR